MTSLQPPRADTASPTPVPADDRAAGSADLGAFIRAQQHALWRHLRLLGADPDEADDLMQEAFVRFAEHQRRGKRIAAPAAFLRGIARNLLIAARRRARRQPPSAEWADAVEQLAGTEPSLYSDARLDALRRCLLRLPERARLAIEGVHVEGQTRAEIAAQLGLGDEGIKSLLGRARQLLRQCIERTLAATARGDQKP